MRVPVFLSLENISRRMETDSNAKLDSIILNI